MVAAQSAQHVPASHPAKHRAFARRHSGAPAGGVSLDLYSWVAVGFGSLIMLIAVALALVVFWRGRDSGMALLVSILLPAYCLQSIGPTESFNTPPSGSPLAIGNTIALASATFAIIYAVFMLFPSGRLVPAWSWALLVAAVVWFAAITAAPTLDLLFLGYPLVLGAAIACQIYRYRRVSTPVERQQTRWAVFGLVTALLANQAFWFTAGVTPLSGTIYPPFAYLVLYGAVLLAPIAFFIAIQRHRLYEIDTLNQPHSGLRHLDRHCGNDLFGGRAEYPVIGSASGRANGPEADRHRRDDPARRRADCAFTSSHPGAD
jgi:hypothetical protein